MSPTLRFWFALAALVLTAGVGAAYWPSGLGLAATLIALLLLLPLTLAVALDAVRYLKARSRPRRRQLPFALRCRFLWGFSQFLPC